MVDRRPVAILLGTDVASHLALNALVASSLAGDWRPVVFVDPYRGPSIRLPRAVQDLHHLERGLLMRVVYPFIQEAACITDPRARSPRELADLGLIDCHHGLDLADGAVSAILDELAVELVISLRCYQRIPTTLIEHVSARGAVLNVHPGRLPEYRGVLTFARSLLEGETSASFTAHHVTSDWDAGPVVHERVVGLSSSRSVLGNMIDAVPAYASAAQWCVDAHVEGRLPPGMGQDSERVRYFTHLTESDLAALTRRGVMLATSAEACTELLDRFCPAHLRTELRSRLIAYLRAAGVSRQTLDDKTEDSR